jgi:hypothetical protein
VRETGESLKFSTEQSNVTLEIIGSWELKRRKSLTLFCYHLSFNHQSVSVPVPAT